jgi:hypothetical protein
MKQRLNPASAARQQLTVFSLNNGRTFLPNPRTNVATHAVFDIIACGGHFQCQLGHCHLQIDHGNGNAVLALKRNDEGWALAALVWEDLEDEDALWRALVDQHNSMLKRLGFPTMPLSESRPFSMPWLGISFAPKFHETASSETVDLAIVTLSEVAFGILRQQRRMSLSN